MKAITVNTGEIIAQGNKLLNPDEVRKGGKPFFNHSFRLIAQWVETNKYKPHQGKRECERRMRQMAQQGNTHG
jgi:hypothetical protein